ncbi:pilus assembly protein TadG [Arthrobacter sp. Soil782]|uniref:pilus assembly protein TadG-related protein n=1 Tax=Arthrobacter sp. Soil782 TaxID=1736410 RepID=UPI0006FE63A9|nr:TadE/TadG family type IV pilus assembly protein [Arthrobacter sp. Soil782]KRF08446.1 pilus assembly protein TadG [Arthrobacter sp. Soil782]
MRRLTKANERERGAVAVIVAILLVVLLGFAALAVDMGMLYSEKAQLQNGADAGALGIAQACAKDTADPKCSGTSSLAKDLADKNSLDGLSNVQSIALDVPNRKVTVTADPLEAGRTDNRVSLFFAGALGIPASSVVAKSTVVWGSPSKGTTPFPLTMSVCQVKGMIDGAKQLIRSHTSNANSDCPEGPSGSDTPGGFGWLAQDPSGCGAYIDLAINESGADTGNDGPSHCNAILNGWAADINAGKDVVILLPVFKSVTGTGSGSSYDVHAFAAFKVRGWKFTGTSDLPLTFRNRAEHHPDKPSVECRGECRGIIGQFVEYVALSSGYEELGPVSEYGATVVKLTN